MSAAAAYAVARARGLAADFWDSAEDIGRMRAVAAADMPPACRALLDHTSHMTVAMEKRHGGPVGVRVLAVRQAGATGYAREILLTDPAGEVVQYGIVRIDLSAVDAATAAAIRAGHTPLGRVLIDAGVLREVHDVSLVEVVPGPRLAALLGAAAPVFGRVATIDLDGRPAVELLEIVAPGGAD